MCPRLKGVAEYVLNTVIKLEQAGIHDLHLWRFLTPGRDLRQKCSDLRLRARNNRHKNGPTTRF
jgi:hypothetical protein